MSDEVDLSACELQVLSRQASQKVLRNITQRRIEAYQNCVSALRAMAAGDKDRTNCVLTELESETLRMAGFTTVIAREHDEKNIPLNRNDLPRVYTYEVSTEKPRKVLS